MVPECVQKKAERDSKLLAEREKVLIYFYCFWTTQK